MFFQTEEYTCGPVALMNLLSWMGEAADFSELFRDCKTDSEGTFDTDFMRVLSKLKKKHGFIFEKTRTMPVDSLLSHLSFSCNAALISHLDLDQDWHWSFWHSGKKDVVTADNVQYRSFADVIGRDDIKRCLRTGDVSKRMVIMISYQYQSPFHEIVRLPAEFTRKEGETVVLDVTKNQAR